MSDEEYVSVRLVGGPRYWAGQSLERIYRRADIEDADPDELGTMLIVPDGVGMPERGEDEDIDPRAVYAPEDGDRYTWHFQGWFPASPSDPPPGWYLQADRRPPT